MLNTPRGAGTLCEFRSETNPRRRLGLMAQAARLFKTRPDFAEAAEHDARCSFRKCRRTQMLFLMGIGGPHCDHSEGACCGCTCGDS